MDLDYKLVRVCEECSARYTKEIEPTEDEIEEFEALTLQGHFIRYETDEEVVYQKSFFICQDCEHSTRMNDIDNTPPQYLQHQPPPLTILNKYRKSD